MSRVYAIGDLHLGHAKLALVRGFVDAQAHDDYLIDAWNRVVSKRDVVYVLGDVFRLERVSDLHGTKKLALGNHDQRPVGEYAKLFTKVRACFEYDDCLLTHIPVHPSQFARWKLNVHGHTHARSIDDQRYVPLSVEHVERGEPVLLGRLIAERIKFLAAAGIDLSVRSRAASG